MQDPRRFLPTTGEPPQSPQCASCGFPINGIAHYRRCVVHVVQPPPRICICGHEEKRHDRLTPRLCKDCKCGAFTRPLAALQAPGLRIEMVQEQQEPPSSLQLLPGATGALVDKVSQKLQVLMLHCAGNRPAEDLLRSIADDLRAHHDADQASDPGLPFVTVRRAVMQGSEWCATTKSNTFAKRVARALNQHKTNRRGV